MFVLSCFACVKYPLRVSCGSVFRFYTEFKDAMLMYFNQNCLNYIKP